jgi:hypothetical protein
VALNLIFLPFIEEDCENPVPNSEVQHLAQQSRRTNALDSDGDALPVEGGGLPKLKNGAEISKRDANDEDAEDPFEPRILTASPKDFTNKKEKFMGKKIRPRFAATELGIREKLFLSFLTSVKTVSSLAVAINQTLPSLNNAKTAFFMGPKDEEKTLPEGMSLVSFSTFEVAKQTLLFHTIKFLAEHYGNAYDWFAFFPDSTYLRGEKLFDFVSDLSITRDLFLGERIEGGNSCTAGGGFILSNVRKMSSSHDHVHELNPVDLTPR